MIETKPLYVIGRTKDDIGRRAAQYFVQVVQSLTSSQDKVNIVVAAGSSPLSFYRTITTEMKERFSWEKLRFISLDEVFGLPQNHPDRFHTIYYEHLFSKAPIPSENILLFNGNATDPEQEMSRFQTVLHSWGGIDITILGMGADGHIGMNFPGTSFDSRIRVVPLPKSFGSEADPSLPQKEASQGITLGIADILSSKKIILLVDGDSKKEALKIVASGIIDQQWPATALSQHPGVSIYIAQNALDKDLSLL